MNYSDQLAINEHSTTWLATNVKQFALTLPAHLLKPLMLIPDTVGERLMTTTLNKVFYVALKEQELDFLLDSWLKLSINDANIHCFITVVENQQGEIKLQVLNTLPANKNKADVELSADTLSLVLLASKQVDPDTLFFQRKLLVTGETELGLAIKNFLDDFDIKEGLPASIQTVINKVQAKFTNT